MESQSRFSEESRVYIDYGRKIKQMNNIFKRERAEFFQILKEEISQEKGLKITSEENKKDKGLKLQFNHSVKSELFSNYGFFSFSRAIGKSSGSGDEESEEETVSKEAMVARTRRMLSRERRAVDGIQRELSSEERDRTLFGKELQQIIAELEEDGED